MKASPYGISLAVFVPIFFLFAVQFFLDLGRPEAMVWLLIMFGSVIALGLMHALESHARKEAK